MEIACVLQTMLPSSPFVVLLQAGCSPVVVRCKPVVVRLRSVSAQARNVRLVHRHQRINKKRKL